jgi:hypothetical protein
VDFLDDPPTPAPVSTADGSLGIGDLRRPK